MTQAERDGVHDRASTAGDSPGPRAPGTSGGAMSDLRSVAMLWPHRQRHNLVIACLDDPSNYEAARPALAALDAQLITEAPGGPLARVLGHPSVTVCDRYLDVRLQARRPYLDAVLTELRAIECACPECPQAGEELW